MQVYTDFRVFSIGSFVYFVVEILLSLVLEVLCMGNFGVFGIGSFVYFVSEILVYLVLEVLSAKVTI